MFCPMFDMEPLPTLSIRLQCVYTGRDKIANIFNCIFLNEFVWIFIEISLKFVPKGRINNIPTLVQIMAWRRPDDKPLPEPIMVRLPTYICVIRPQWVIRSMYLITQYQKRDLYIASYVFKYLLSCQPRWWWHINSIISSIARIGRLLFYHNADELLKTTASCRHRFWSRDDFQLKNWLCFLDMLHHIKKSCWNNQ